jgi:hypothetical protein
MPNTGARRLRGAVGLGERRCDHARRRVLTPRPLNPNQSEPSRSPRIAITPPPVNPLALDKSRNGAPADPKTTRPSNVPAQTRPRRSSAILRKRASRNPGIVTAFQLEPEGSAHSRLPSLVATQTRPSRAPRIAPGVAPGLAPPATGSTAPRADERRHHDSRPAPCGVPAISAAVGGLGAPVPFGGAGLDPPQRPSTSAMDSVPSPTEPATTRVARAGGSRLPSKMKTPVRPPPKTPRRVG